ncbi:MAG: hypothetical protein QOI96_133 [Verrucomicrobiota bacterium]|jgi:hypothetical protein
MIEDKADFFISMFTASRLFSRGANRKQLIPLFVRPLDAPQRRPFGAEAAQLRGITTNG